MCEKRISNLLFTLDHSIVLCSAKTSPDTKVNSKKRFPAQARLFKEEAKHDSKMLLVQIPSLVYQSGIRV